MSVPEPPVLEFPAMLHGRPSAIRRAVRVKGQQWAQGYLKKGGFTQPRRMLPVPPGELLLMHSGAEIDIYPRPRWRIYMFHGVFLTLSEGTPKEESQRMEDTFESFCLSTPWGALDYAVSPMPPRSAERMAQRLAALLRFWDVLQSPRYVYRTDDHHTLDELIEYIYRETLDAWCPGGPASVREHLALTVERMARASREECMEVLLRVIPVLVEMDAGLKHREQLLDPGFLRERLAMLPEEDFGDISSAWKYTVFIQLTLWDRELGRHQSMTGQ